MSCSQGDIRNISVNHWGSELGLQVLRNLSRLYTSLVWESTVLLAFCSEDSLPTGCAFGKADLDKLIKPDTEGKDTPARPGTSDSRPGVSDSVEDRSLSRSIGEMGSNGVSAAMQSLSTSETANSPMDVEESLASPSPGPGTTDSADTATTPSASSSKKNKLPPTLQAQIKQIKPLLSASSRLGRALAELFGLLVKLSVGSPVRQRRIQQLPTTPLVPTPAARDVASSLSQLLSNGMSWTPPPYSPVPKLR